MAESIVISVIQQLIPLVREDAKLMGGLANKFEGVKEELENIRYVIKDAEERARQEYDVKLWVKQLRLVAYRIEDAIDEFVLLDNLPVAARWPHRVQVLARWSRHFIRRRQLAGFITDIQADVREISSRRERYNLEHRKQAELNASHQNPEGGATSNISWGDPRVCFLFTDETELVNIEAPIQDIKKLLDLKLEEPRRSVISIIGMGGVGKTTLARKVYTDKAVQTHFPTRAWVTVSETYRTVDILRTMLKNFHKAADDTPSPHVNVPPSKLETADKESLIEQLREYLQDKRYLVVLDDVWDRCLWDYISSALPYNVQGSRIMITTRNEWVTSTTNSSSLQHCYQLKPLSDEEAWQLFCKKAFCSEGNICPPELEKLSSEMVKRSGGLPLAIVAIGGLLSTKDKDMTEWQKLNSSLSYELGTNPRLEHVNKILSLSYHGLPFYLKPCFLYFGIFPEDYSISRMRLIRLWIAEGFIPKVTGKTLEEVAEEYLTELLHRNLLQVTKRNLKGKAESFQVHDLMREVILTIGKELSFSQEWDGNSPVDSSIRRLSVRGNALKDSKSLCKSHARSLFLFPMDKPWTVSRKLFKKMKLLKVLDFEGASIDHIPKGIGKLLHLRYISLRRTKVRSLPKSIGKLFNLLTLDLKHSLISELPAEIRKLTKLRHLLVYKDEMKPEAYDYRRRGVLIPAGVLGHLTDLQKLSFLEADELMEELNNLTSLRKLGLRVSRTNSRQLASVLLRATLIHSLSITSDDVVELNYANLVPPSMLSCLYLDGNVGSVLPSWITRLNSLVRLHVRRYSNFGTDPIKIFRSLPNLVDLRLDEAHRGTTLSFVGNCFPKLKELHLLRLYELESLVIETGSMPLLETLRIGPSRKLQEVPEGLLGLKMLKILDFFDMPPEFMDHIHPGIGKSYYIIEHIPCVQNQRWEGTLLKSFPLSRNWGRPSGNFLTLRPHHFRPAAFSFDNQHKEVFYAPKKRVGIFNPLFEYEEMEKKGGKGKERI